jgi:hypothetical protein
MIQNMRQRSGSRPPISARRSQTSTVDAKRHYERYLALALEAQRSGDIVETQNCYQHAEHYFRVMREADEARQQ